MSSLLKFDQTTLANMTASLEYVTRKLPLDRDNPAIRKQIASAIVASAEDGNTSLGKLTDVALAHVNLYLFPPGRRWLRALGR